MNQPEEDQKESVESHAGKPFGLDTTGEQMPGHLIMQKVSAKSYQDYMGKLKRGGSSGISDVFGQASEIFGGRIAEETDRLDLASFADAPAELDRRAAYLVAAIYDGCKGFLSRFAVQPNEHSHSNTESMGTGSKTGKEESGSGAPSKLDSALKGLVTANLMLLALEQSERGATPPWFASFLGQIFKEADRILPTPTLNEVLYVISKGGVSTEPGVIARDAATSVTNILGAGAVGESAWSDLHNALTGASKLRYSLLKNVLEQPVEKLGL
jgi:hypothetical protein